MNNICCKKCGSVQYVKAGKYVDGRQRYKCNACHSFFVWEVKQRKGYKAISDEIQCRNCNSKNLVRAGKASGGRQIYQCKDCTYKMTWDSMTARTKNQSYTMTDVRKSSTPNDIQCTRCDSGNVVKAGRREDGRQKYLCRDCHCTFTWETKNRNKISIPEDAKCSKCGTNENLIGRGTCNGNQLFYCKKCGLTVTYHP